MGQILDSEGVTKAIVDMAEPQEVGDLRRFLGMVNHLKVYPNLAEKTKPLRELFKKENAWV